jgi:hypothetical protein
MDALSDVLRAAHLNGGVFLQAEFTAPWCMAARVTPQFCAPFLGPTATASETMNARSFLDLTFCGR